MQIGRRSQPAEVDAGATLKCRPVNRTHTQPTYSPCVKSRRLSLSSKKKKFFFLFPPICIFSCRCRWIIFDFMRFVKYRFFASWCVLGIFVAQFILRAKLFCLVFYQIIFHFTSQRFCQDQVYKVSTLHFVIVGQFIHTRRNKSCNLSFLLVNLSNSSCAFPYSERVRISKETICSLDKWVFYPWYYSFI